MGGREQSHGKRDLSSQWDTSSSVLLTKECPLPFMDIFSAILSIIAVTNFTCLIDLLLLKIDQIKGHRPPIIESWLFWIEFNYKNQLRIILLNHPGQLQFVTKDKSKFGFGLFLLSIHRLKVICPDDFVSDCSLKVFSSTYSCCDLQAKEPWMTRVM